MVTIKIYFVDSSFQEYEEDDPKFIFRLKEIIQSGYSGKELIKRLISDDWAAPPKSITIKGYDSTGNPIDMSIPYE